MPREGLGGQARAYIVDDTNGTRSGPIRDARRKDDLAKDLKYLQKNAQGTFNSSGIARPGDAHWTVLPADSIFPDPNHHEHEIPSEPHHHEPTHVDPGMSHPPEPWSPPEPEPEICPVDPKPWNPND